MVIVRPGRYAGFDLRTDGTAANPIVFHAEPGVVIDTPNPVRPSEGINLEGADYVVIEGFTITGMPRAGIRSVINHHATIRHNTTDGNGRWGIFSGFSDDLLIEKNVAARSQLEHGIYVSNSGDRPIIRGNLVWGNHGCGIHMNGDASMGGDGIISGALVEGNTIYDNGRGGGSGINADGVQDALFVNNLLYGNHASGVSLYRIDGAEGSKDNVVAHNTIVQAADGRWAINIKNGSTGNTVVNNILYNNHPFRGSINILPDSLPGFSSHHNVVMERFSLDDGSSVMNLAGWRAATGQEASSLVAIPAALFVDPATNYHLRSDSPARDAGLTLPGIVTDIDGVSRPADAASDIGAYEVAGAPPAPEPPVPSPSPPPPPAPGRPDLVEAMLGNPPASVVRGRSFTVQDTVRNQGPAAAAASITRYYLSLDRVMTGGDKLLSGRRLVPAVGPGQESGGTVTLKIPSTTTPGTYFLLACADYRKTVAESDETNNCTASVTSVTVTR